jgi:STE24 endopeptidase
MLARASLRSPGARILAAGVAALAVAELAVWLLAPSLAGPAAVAVDPAAYFEPAALERSVDFRADLRLAGIVVLLCELALLAALALGRPRFAQRALARLSGPRPVLGAAIAGLGLSLLLALVALPSGLWAHERAVEVGLSTQDLGGWLLDRVRAAAIGALLAAAGAAILIGLQRRLPRRWWLAGSGVVVTFAIASTFLAPVVLAPVFNDFEPLGPGPARAEVLELADRAGVEVDEVLRVDASRRGRGLNAYVDGIGSTRRIVIYDNLLDRAERPELRSLVAHELGHVAGDDIPRGLLYVALVAPLGLLFVREAGGPLAARTGAEPGTAAALPAYALALAIAVFALGIPGNQLSRAIEERADRFALELTGDPGALVDLQVRLAEVNRSDPDPPGWAAAVFSSHPSTVERIGLALAYDRTEG